MPRITTDWLWTRTGEKYPIYTRYLPMWPKFSSFFQLSHILQFPMLSGQKKNKKTTTTKTHTKKSICLNFTILWTTWWRSSIGVSIICMNFVGEFDVHFQKRCRLKFVLPYGPMLRKRKQNWKNKTIIILKNKKKSGDIMDIGVNWLDSFWENWCYGETDGGTDGHMDDRRPRDDSSSAVQCKTELNWENWASDVDAWH